MLPDRLGDYRRAELAFPAPPGVAAWRIDATSEPVILRCGLERPDDFVVGSPLQVVDEVSWFRVAEADRVTWFAVDRPVYVALTLPQDSGPTPIQELSDVIAKTLPAKPINPAPALTRAPSSTKWRSTRTRPNGRFGVFVGGQRRPVPRASAVSTMAANRVG